MNSIKYFEVKTGKNRGHYLSFENMNKQEVLDIMRTCDIHLGILDRKYNYSFYKYHGNKNGYIVTPGSMTTYEYNKKLMSKYVEILVKNNYMEV